MGDSKTEEDRRGQEDHITLWPNGTEAIISSDLSVSHENQNKLMTRGTMDWPVEKQRTMNNKPEEKSENNTIRFSLDGSASGNLRSATGPSPVFLAALTSLGEHADHMLLPHSLHQIAEAYFLEEDYQWAVQFLRLEMLYHERLLSNLASMQKDWESRWKAVSQAKSCSPVKIQCTETETEAKRMNSLNRICRTHQRPNRSGEKQVTRESITVQQTSTGNPFKMKEWTEKPWSDAEEENGGEEEGREAESLTEVVQEAVARRQRLSREELTEHVEVEETFPSNGLISILKKRTCLEESSPVNHSPPRSSSKFKVRFSETDALLDNDEVGEDSCLFFLVLCLVTVVISMGGTMIYCFLGGAYSNICTDFSHNMDLCFGFIRRVVDTLTHWFIPASS